MAQATPAYNRFHNLPDQALANAPHGDEEVSSVERLARIVLEKIEVLERQRVRAAGQER
jgi:hypothetical protein